MPERLTDCLIRRGQLTKRRADEAFERQVLMGGALDTSLIELGHATEDAVVEGMAAAYGLATASTRHARAERDDRALRAFPEQWAHKHLLAPLAFDEETNTLSVLSPAPADVNLIVRLGDLLDLTIRPLLTPEFRVQERIAFLYGHEPPERFRALIANASDDGSTPTEDLPPILEPEPEPEPETRPEALTFGEAVSRLRNAADRDEIVRITLLYAIRDLEHASVFITHDDRLEGWLGYGPGSENVPGLEVLSGHDSAFSVVLETSAHYLGPLPVDGEHERFLSKLGRPHPRAVLIVPIRIQNRTVALLYGENGAAPIAPRIAADLMLFTTHVQVALSDLLLRRKAETLSELTRAEDPIEAELVDDDPIADDSLDDIDVMVGDPTIHTPPPEIHETGAPGNGAVPGQVALSVDLDIPIDEEIEHDADEETSGVPIEAPIEMPAEGSSPDSAWEPVDVDGLDELGKELDQTIAAAQAAMSPDSEPLLRPPGDDTAGDSLFPTGDLEQGLLDELDELEGQLTLAPSAPPRLETLAASASEPDEEGGWESVEVDDSWDGDSAESAKLSAIRTSIVEDATVPDLSAEAWLRASSETTRARPLPLEVMERAAMPEAREPVPLTRITVGQKEIAADIVEINGFDNDHRSAEEPVPLTRLVSDRAIPADPIDPLLDDDQEPVPLTKLSTSQQLTAMPIPGSISELPSPFAFDEEVDPTPEGVAVHQVVDAMGRLVPPEPSLPPPAPVVDPTTLVTSPWERQLSGYLSQLGSDSEEERIAAIDALTKAGPSTLDKICERFPGPLLVDPFSPEATNLPPFAKCGALLSILERYGWDAHEHVVRRLDAPDPLVRFFAIYFYAAVFVPDAVPRLIQRLHDEESRICMLAARTLFSYREHPDFGQVLEHLHGRLQATSITARRHAAYLIGLFRDVTAIPMLIDVLDHKDKGMVDVAEDALAEIAKQRFNGSGRKWRAWWARNEAKSRIEWLIEGLGSKDLILRRSAAEELRAVTGMDMGFDEDGPKRDRDEARQRWQSWWDENNRT